MSVPKAAMDEDSFSLPTKDNIRPARKLGRVQPETKAVRMQ